jgi:GR25 family glycosyltransferase involved in LPS biosynthesis
MSLFFDKILIVGFENSDRINQMKKIYSDFDLEIIPAFNGRELKGVGGIKQRRSPGARINTDEFYDCFQDSNGKIYNCAFTMTNLELGCTLAHVRANEFIIKNNLKNVLVIEDDAYPLGIFPNLPIIDFDYDVNILFVKDINKKIFYINNHQFTTVAYMIKDRIASEKYLKIFETQGYYCADTPFGDPSFGLNVWRTSNSVFYHDWSTSFISQDVKIS